jgi:uncharacterized protein
MLLLDDDVRRISEQGYAEDFFSTVTSEGFKLLKNSKEGRCVFHDGTKCTIYDNRPKGCKLYPIVFNEDSMSAVRDNFCPFKEEFKLSMKAKMELSSIYPRLLSESSDRIKIKRMPSGHLIDQQQLLP